ncbi:MAG: N-acyl homoserine lactonase family protein [Phenylobacterium sp.]
MKMHILSGGRLKMRSSVYYPDAAREDTFELPVLSVLLKHKQGNVLVDTGCSPDAAKDPVARWGAGLARYMPPIFEPGDAVVNQLPKAGLTADDIDVVVCTHLHPDHCGCNAYFKRATLIAHEAELAVAKAEGSDAQGYFQREWDHGGKIDELAGERDLFGDGKITLVPMPGHSAGMTVAVAALEKDGEFVIASDAVPVRAVLDKRYAPKNTWNAERAVAVLDEIARFEDKGATIILGHDDAQWKSLKTGEAFYE